MAINLSELKRKSHCPVFTLSRSEVEDIQNGEEVIKESDGGEAFVFHNGGRIDSRPRSAVLTDRYGTSNVPWSDNWDDLLDGRIKDWGFCKVVLDEYIKYNLP